MDPRRRCTGGIVLAVLGAGCTVPTQDPPAPPASSAASLPSLARPGVLPDEAPAFKPRGTRRWRLQRPALRGEIEGFTSATSALPGEPVSLHVSTTAQDYRVHVYRIGSFAHGDGALVWTSARLPGRRQADPAFADRKRRTVVARWRPSLVLETTGWRPGLHVLKLVTDGGRQGHVPFVVRSPSARGRTALVFPVTTWQAYNRWGGHSLYIGLEGDRRSWAVSFDRPYAAPGTTDLMYGAAPVVTAAEALGVPLAYLTNIDVGADPDALAGARTYVSVGHDEYWSTAMRDHVEQARDAGTNLVFLGANTSYWRVREEQAGRVVVGYRGDAGVDPGPGRTGRWRDGARPRPEDELTSMRYECFPVDAPLRVADPSWWGFAGTGARAGDEHPHLVGVEADRVYPVPGTPRPLQVLAHVEYSCGGVTTSAQSTYATVPSDAAILNVGTLRWTCALVDRCHVPLSPRTVRFVRQVTATVLRELARGPGGRRHPARDNVARFHLPRTNQVPAS